MKISRTDPLEVIMQNHEKVRCTYADYIRSLEPFHWFCTLTMAYRVHREQANRYFFKFLRKLNESVIRRRYREKHLPGICWVRALEFQKNGNPHIHILLKHPELECVKKNLILNLWRASGPKTGIINRVEKYNPTLGACWYLTKDIFDGSEIDFSESITWSRRKKQNFA